MLVEIDPKIRANVDRLVAQVGETEFRRGVAHMTRWELDDMSLDDVASLYVLARQGRVGPPDRAKKWPDRPMRFAGAVDSADTYPSRNPE